MTPLGCVVAEAYRCAVAVEAGKLPESCGDPYYWDMGLGFSLWSL